MKGNKTYNKKAFLSPNSLFSMSSYHATIEPDGIFHFRVHDCKNGVHIWNDLSEPEQVIEAIEKLRCLASAASDLAEFIENNYK